MSTPATVKTAVETLQQLGLKEYEARCFVGLSRLSAATAKQLSEITDVPRTRVYDAVRVLEAQGLVEIQHSSPQRFRAVPLEEAVETLRDRYESRIDRLATALENAEATTPGEQEPVQEVWTISGTDAIANRANKLVAAATEEVVLVIGDEALLTTESIESLNGLDGVDLLVGAVTEPLQERVHAAVPDAESFLSGLDWLCSDSADELVVGRLLLVDRSTVLVSTITPDTREEQAIFGGGFRNGLIVIARRLLARRLVSDRQTE